MSNNGGYRDDNGFSYPEELQRDPDPPRRSSFRVWLVAGAIILAVVVGMLAL
jgi:hypothetical protein